MIRTAAALLATAAPLGACSSSDDDSDVATADGASTTVDAGTVDEAVTVDDASADDGESTSAEVGTGVLRIDGTEYDGFVGDCEISREAGAEDVGDLSNSGLEVIVAIDNVESQPAEELNFVMIDETSFRVLNAPGTIESISETGARTTSGSSDVVTAVFAGPLDDGRAVEAEVVCSLQNAF